MFTKILVANRGEIACRIIRTARRMGVRTVAVYSEADRSALHVALADEAVAIGPAPALQSYLDMDRLVAACRESGAQALHPGYGFLSENAEFARRVEAAGVVFIGPKYRAIEAMADKIAARLVASAAGVAVVPGHDAAIGDVEQAAAIAGRIGYPVMLKASAGGGGRGLRIAADDAALRGQFEACRAEAFNAFGNGDVFIERYVPGARHIEIQVLCDAHGNAVSLGERECSIQRRHQKIIEEAPSPFVDPGMREAMAAQALSLACAVGYESAGTVEFIVAPDRTFWFLEFNTRLQVEHPVTERVTGIDLVEQMIRIAAGEPLMFRQEDVALDGWAIECRITAEDPARGFMPSAGRLVRFRPPAHVPGGVSMPRDQVGLRIDAGVQEGSEVPPHYDSMVAKVVTHGRDRSQAIDEMRVAIDGFVVRGVSTNLPLLAAMLGSDDFAGARLTTEFVSSRFPDGFSASHSVHGDPGFLVALAAAVHSRRGANGTNGHWDHEPLNGSHGTAVSPNGAGHRLNGFDAGLREGVYGQKWSVVLRDEDQNSFDATVMLRPEGTLLVATVDGRHYPITMQGGPRELVVIGRCGDREFVAQVERFGLGYRIVHGGAQVTARVFSEHESRFLALMPAPAARAAEPALFSPMSGLLVDLQVRAGQNVRKGERLATVEAMKMENVLVSPCDARIDEVLARPGDSLSVGQVIIRFA